MKNHVFAMHFRRMFTSPLLYLAIVLYALSMHMVSGNMHMGNTVMLMMECTYWEVSGIRFLTICVVPALAYAMTYASDHGNRSLYFIVQRSGTVRYAMAYYITAWTGGFLVSLLGNGLFVVMNLLRGIPLYSDPPTAVNAYLDFFRAGPVTSYFAVVMLDLSLAAPTMVCVAAAAGSIFRHRFAALGIPVIFYFGINLVADDTVWNIERLCRLGSYAGDGLQPLMPKMIVALVFFVVGGVITVAQIKRRVHHA